MLIVELENVVKYMEFRSTMNVLNSCQINVEGDMLPMITMMNSLLIDLFKVIYILYLMQRTYDLIIVCGQVFIISFQLI